MTGSLLAYARLLRLPNLFTALADIAAGYLFTQINILPLHLFGLLLLASGGIYLAGMVLNDVFDRDIDAVERPFRPLPSGQISVRTAWRLGLGLLAGGLVCAALVTGLTGDPRPAAVATVLAILVVVYDKWAKHTPLGPVAMGSCRGLNLLLGMSLSPDVWSTPHFLVAGGLAVYIIGVTWFARQEAEESSQLQLFVGLVIMVGGLVLIGLYPRFDDRFDLRPLGFQWYFLLAIVGLILVRRGMVAVMHPQPKYVQETIKLSLLSIIMIDAIIVVALHGWPPALGIIALLIPTLLLGRWVYST